MPFRRVNDVRQSTETPVAIVLSGGGARGAFQVGVWEVLREHPRGVGALPSVVSGTSAGAINGYLIAAGLSAQEMLRFWLGLAERPPVVASERFFATLTDAILRALASEPLRGPKRRLREARILGSMFTKHRMLRASGLDAAILEFFVTARFDTLSRVLQQIRSAYLFDVSPLADRLHEATRGRDPNATGVRLAINTVDVRTGGIVRFVNHPPEKRAKASVHYRYVPVITPEIVLASASIPLLFNPVTTSTGDLCWDGGLLVNTPLAPTVALGAQRIIPVLVTPRRKLDNGEMGTFGSAVERLADAFLENAYATDRKLLLDRNALAAKLGDPMLRTVDLFRAIRPASSRTFDAGSYLYFEQDAMLAMYREGKRAATRWLEDGPEIDARETEDA